MSAPVKGVWIDTPVPQRRGFSDIEGIHPSRVASNSAWPGFKAVRAARKFADALPNPECWHVVDRRAGGKP